MIEPKYLHISPNILLPLDGFTESTALSHLTVRQFVELLVSVNSQLSGKGNPASDALYETVKAVKAIVANRENNEPIEEVVERARAEIIKRMPAMTSEIRSRSANEGGVSPLKLSANADHRQPEDGGLSPHAKK